MSVPSFKTAEERKISRIDRFKPAILPLALFAGGILNGARDNPALLIVGVVSGCIALALADGDKLDINRKSRPAVFFQICDPPLFHASVRPIRLPIN